MSFTFALLFQLFSVIILKYQFSLLGVTLLWHEYIWKLIHRLWKIHSYRESNHPKYIIFSTVAFNVLGTCYIITKLSKYNLWLIMNYCRKSSTSTFNFLAANYWYKVCCSVSAKFQFISQSGSCDHFKGTQAGGDPDDHKKSGLSST